jgi:glutamine synthetase
MRDGSGRNVFAVADAELQTGRRDAAYQDTKFISEECEWFLAGVLGGLADGEWSAFAILHHCLIRCRI